MFRTSRVTSVPSGRTSPAGLLRGHGLAICQASLLVVGTSGGAATSNQLPGALGPKSDVVARQQVTGVGALGVAYVPEVGPASADPDAIRSWPAACLSSDVEGANRSGNAVGLRRLTVIVHVFDTGVMDGSQVVDFTAVDATAGQVAAWIRAADADGEWWAEEWPEDVATAAGVGQSAAGELGGAGVPGDAVMPVGPGVAERPGPGRAEADHAVDLERLLAGLEGCRVADRRVLTPIVEPSVTRSSDSCDGSDLSSGTSAWESTSAGSDTPAASSDTSESSGTSATTGILPSYAVFPSGCEPPELLVPMLSLVRWVIRGGLIHSLGRCRRVWPRGCVRVVVGTDP